MESLSITTLGNQGFGSIGISANSADLGCGDPMVIPVAIKNTSWKPASAMIESGASTQFIDPDFARQLGLPLDLKPVAEAFIVLDGHKAAPFTHTCILDLRIDQNLETLTFQVTNLAGWQLILGKTWLK